MLPGIGFVSGSHDCSLRVWSLEGDVLAELLGHTAIIYHVAATADGLIASGVPGGMWLQQVQGMGLIACCLKGVDTILSLSPLFAVLQCKASSWTHM